MKKRLSVCFVVMLIIAYFVPFAVSASEPSIAEENTVYTDIEEFIANKSYYDALILQGIGVGVSVGDEYSDAEVERLLGLPGSVNKSADFSTWGTSQPTEVYNVHTGPNYEIESTTAEFSSIYSNVKFTGCTLYVINVFNYDYNNTLEMIVYGTKNGTARYTAQPRYYLYQPVRTNSSSDTFFFAFSPICNTAGYVSCCPAQ